ncbi:MAG TPA: hypothetical protein VN285_01465, partial [Candidatus Deferrimicrobium sp.]|nr:hypothetical protein [Candidatus Deferrimicrobium sp.]
MIRYSALHVGRSVAVLSLMLAAAQSPVAASRSYLGMTLPYPREIPTFSSQATAPYLLHERLVPAVLVIDTAGQVIGVSSETESDSVFVQYTETWLKGVSFEPARFDDGKIAARLPMTLRFRPRIAQPEVSFPMDSAAAVLDPDLYFKFLALNDVQPPRVERFPAYFCDLTPTDTS